jgi:hypothetical protein
MRPAAFYFYSCVCFIGIWPVSARACRVRPRFSTIQPRALISQRRSGILFRGLLVHFHVEDFLSAAVAYACGGRQKIARIRGVRKTAAITAEQRQKKQSHKRTFLVCARLTVCALCNCLAYSTWRSKVLGLAVLVDEQHCDENEWGTTEQKSSERTLERLAGNNTRGHDGARNC